MRSVWVDSTTIVSVRTTPSIDRIRLISSSNDDVFAGQIWTPAVHRWTPAGWAVVYEAERDQGGSAVSDLLFDPAGRLWALTTKQLIVFDGRAGSPDPVGVWRAALNRYAK